MDKAVTGKTKPEKNLQLLEKFTQARVALGRCGSSVLTGDHLDFQLGHAMARDAVKKELNFEKTACEIGKRMAVHMPHPEILILESMAQSKDEYLLRPDLGRALSESSKEKALAFRGDYDIVILIADGLSSKAIETNAVPLLGELMPVLCREYKIAPFGLVRYGRVAVADDVAFNLNASLSVILIGERPGLKTPDSMGIYMTYDPRPGTTDERRNCISNIRPGGMTYGAASSKLLYLIRESLRRELSGVGLKDEEAVASVPDVKAVE